MSPARTDPAPPPPPAVPVAAASFSSPARFWVHAFAWLLVYFTVVIAWGQRNSWPEDLILCVLMAPMNALIIATLYAAYGFGLALDPQRSQQEQLIAALILAVGIASGQLLLMNLGLVALAVAWLRPARPGVDWTEWLKIPLILLTSLPFWLDLQGSRAPIFGIFDDPAGNPIYQLPLALNTTQNRILGYCALLSLILLLHGRIFWMAIPVLPAFLIAVALFPKWIPHWSERSPNFRQIAPWVLGVLLLVGLSWLAARVDALSRRIVSGEMLRRWFEERRYPPWLAVLVIAVVQALPFRDASSLADQRLAIGGIAVMAVILILHRYRTSRGPIHSRSITMVAGALVLTLLAEFATNDSLRRIAVGFALVGLLSWHRFWHLRIYIVASAASVVLLAVPAEFAPVFTPSPGLLVARTIASSVLLALLAWFTISPQPAPGPIGYPDEEWSPPKRFALILLGLMLLFQTAGAFWPDHDMRKVDRSSQRVFGEPNDRPQESSNGRTFTYRVLDKAGPVYITESQPSKNPYLIESPERVFLHNGWRVTQRLRFPHPRGDATAIQVQRDGQTLSTLWWFEQGSRTFSNHLYARRVLWSSWHLADRRLRQIRLESVSITDPRDLADFAARHQWFPQSDPSRIPTSQGY